MTTQQQPAAVKKFGLPHILLILGLSVLLCGEAYFGYRMYTVSHQQEQIKEDYSMSNNVTFGIFSVDQWKDKIADVVNHQVTDYSMTRAQKRALLVSIEKQLNALVDKTVAQIDKPQKGLGAKLKKMAFHAMVNTDDIHAQVPSFAKTIVDKVSSPASQARLKGIASSKIVQLEKQIHDSTSAANYEVTKYLYKKYNVSTPEDYNKQIDLRLAAIRTVTYNYAYAMVGCVLLALCLWLLMRKLAHLQTVLFVMSLLFAFILLAVGVTSAIIELDARIKTLNFMLMGEKVEFVNQVLFFQSKSLLQIVQTLIRQSKPDAVVVGVLILLFVIVLPILRMIAKGIHILSPKKVADNKIVKYLTFELGKWDMADVMVIGILMTYIGLNGILKSQLSNLNVHNSFLTTTTENNTSLQPGYFIFVAYVIYEWILSYILKRITPHKTD